MGCTSRFADKLSTLLFLCVKREAISNIFGVDIEKEVYMPVPASRVTEKVKNGEDTERVPVDFFVEGMFYVLGADENFVYNSAYKDILRNTPGCIPYIKGVIYKIIKEKNYVDAYIITKGLSLIEETTEVCDKLLLLVENLRVTNTEFEEEEIALIERFKNIEGYAIPYLYEAIIKREKGDYDSALFSINNYFTRGGESTPEAIDLRIGVKIDLDYKNGKDLVSEQPAEALKLLLPLLEDIKEDAVIYYYIAIAYRNLDNYEKAIYYLNEAMMIDDAMPEVVNEMGINYACLGDYESAVAYLRKAFEATKAIEICTNIIMCYINLKNLEQARLHLEIAKKIDAKDEIVSQLELLLRGEK